MNTYLRIVLNSDSCFAGGAGFAGEVDTDIEQEINLGLPKIRGKTLKGLLLEETSLFLQTFSSDALQRAAARLYGVPGAAENGLLELSDACVPQHFRNMVIEAIEREDNVVNRERILKSLTAIRYQTAIDRQTGAPRQHSLRNTRVALAGLVLHAPFTLKSQNSELKTIFACSALSLRRGGLNRNRGWGRIEVRIYEDDQDVTAAWADGFQLQSHGGEV